MYTDWVNEMDLLTTAKERMFLVKGNNFQCMLSKPCFSHNLLCLLKNRKNILACADTHISCDSSQLGGVHNLTSFTLSFWYQNFMRRHENTCSPDAAMTLGLIFHLLCFSVALLHNWTRTDIFIDGVRFPVTKKMRVSCPYFRDKILSFYTHPIVLWLNFCLVA